MAKSPGPSPGHREHPEHKIVERRVGPMKVEAFGEVVAESRDVVEVAEDGAPLRFYFPRSDVKMEKLARTDTTSRCPFKGEASYFTLNAGGHSLPDVVWSYEDPYAEHAALKDRLAFWDDKAKDIVIRHG